LFFDVEKTDKVAISCPVTCKCEESGIDLFKNHHILVRQFMHGNQPSGYGFGENMESERDNG
jgi:hypothetical protein